jgi:hypothetical protein
MVSKGRNSITFKEVTNEVSDVALVWYYLGISELPCFIKSPLRQDNRPSFGLYSKDGERVFYTDLATKEHGGIYDLLALMWQCPYDKVLTRIKKDLPNIKKGTNVTLLSSQKSMLKRNDVTLEVVVREWRQYDIEYWSSYGVPLAWLKYAGVYPISHKIVSKQNSKYTFNADKYAYAFVEHKEGNVTLKIYQPFNKEGYKWSNKHDRSVISLWTKIPKTGERVIICASLKDALCLWANTGIPCLALQGEGYNMSNTAIADLQFRFHKVYILFDNDKAGIDNGKALSEKTGFINLVLPKFEGGKDISDLWKCKGKEQFLAVIKSLLDPKVEAQMLLDDDLPF